MQTSAPPSPAPHTSTTSSVAETYRIRRERFGVERDRYQKQSDRNANLNVLLFAIAFGFTLAALWKGDAGFIVLAVVGVAAFVASFVHHIGIDRQLRRYKELVSINAEGDLRLDRAWTKLPLRAPSARTRDGAGNEPWRPYAVDLDLLGHASLQHLLNTPGTLVGQTRLQSWIVLPAAPATIRTRQGAVADLAPRNDFRDELALAGRLMGDQLSYEPFLAWAEGESWLAERPWLIWVARGMAVITLLLIALQLVDILHAPFWLLAVVVNVILTYTLGGAATTLIDTVADRQSVVQSYVSIFRLISAQQFTDPTLLHLQATLTAGGRQADVQMQRLWRIMQAAEIRKSFIFLFIQPTTLWNFHILALLEDWQRESGSGARAWLDAIGEIEALSALATLAHDNPDWEMPTISEDLPPVLSATGLGHPLLPPTQRVGNDVSIGPPGSFLLVTGSNMSGKSTLLRAIGMNVTLAQMGAPVCAAAFRLPPVQLASSIRIQDSLERGVSYFMAELQRLRRIVDEADAAKVAGGRTLLFLLDEILHGTNTTERQIAARRIINHLLAQAAMGAVSTHDLSLADAPEFAATATAVHFTETFTRSADGPAMHFDYTLRPGIATSTNALKLMEIVGLPLE